MRAWWCACSQQGCGPPADGGPSVDPFGILSALIAPTVLVAACAQLILVTSQRTGRVVDQLRLWSDEYAALRQERPGHAMLEARRELVFELIGISTNRARYLQSVLMTMVLAVGFFVATGLAVAGSALLNQLDLWWGWYVWVPVMLGLAGSAAMLFGCILLIREGELAMRTTLAETRYLMDWRAHAMSNDEVAEPQFRPRAVGR
jgi:hypothetical protein